MGVPVPQPPGHGACAGDRDMSPESPWGLQRPATTWGRAASPWKVKLQHRRPLFPHLLPFQVLRAQRKQT